jgi:hypothetical protein
MLRRIASSRGAVYVRREAMVSRTNGYSPANPARDEHAAVTNGDVSVLERAAVRRLHANDITVERSAIVVSHAERATLTSSSAVVVLGRSVACDETRVGILAAPVIRGEVHTLIDLRSAVAIGLGMALGRALLVGGRELVARRRA